MKDGIDSKKNQRWQQRGWRSVYWTIGLVLASQLIAGLLLDYRFPYIKFPAANRVLSHCPKDVPGPLIVTLGSSRFDGGIMVPQITCELRDATGKESLQVANLAVGCGDLIVAEFLYDKLRELGIKPAHLVIEVSPETLNNRNVWLDQHAYRQLTWEDTFTYTTDLVRSGHFIRFWRSRLFPLYIHREQLVRHASLAMVVGKDAPRAVQEALLAPSLKEDDIRWADPRLKTDAGLRTEAGLDNIRRWLKKYHVGGAAAASLDRILQNCEQDNIAVLLVGVPVSSKHRELYRPEIEVAFLHHLKAITQSHQHVRFVDLRAAIPDQGFTDNHHLTPEGGKQFSHILTETALLPALQDTHFTSTPDMKKGP